MIVNLKFTDEKFYIPVNMPAMQLFFLSSFFSKRVLDYHVCV